MLRSTILKATALPNAFLKNIHTSSLVRWKELYVEEKDEKTTVIGAKFVDSPRKPFLLNFPNNDKCPLCQLKLDLKHTDVMILSQYINNKGKILPRKHTKLCQDQYKLVKELIYMAQYAGLLHEPPKEEPKKPYLLLNTYYDETTIKLRPKHKKHHIRFHYLKMGPIQRLRVKPEEGYYYGTKNWR